MLRVALLSCVFATALSGCDWFMSAEQRIQRAEKSLAAGEDRAAAIELQKALGSAPDNFRARMLLARISLSQGDAQGAENELKRAIANHAPARDVAVLAADIHLAKGEYTALLSMLEGGKSGLDATSVAIYRGKAQLGMRDVDAATASFEAALAAAPDSTEARLGLAEAVAEGGNFDSALAEIDKVLATVPGEAHAWSLKGRILGRRGEFNAARDALANARKNAGGQLTALELHALLSSLIEANIAAGNIPAARSTLDELSKRAPDAPLVHLLLARIAMVEQNYALAVTEAQTVVAAAPNHPMAKLVLGAALLANGNVNQAEVALSELVQLAPENLEARKLLANANLRLHRPEIAMQVLTPSPQSGSADPQVDALLAWANLQRGDDAVAVGLLQRSVAAQPANEDLKLDLAMAYVTAGRYQEAIDLLDSMPARPGSDRREQLLIAAIAKVRSPKDAQAEVERIIKANPKDKGVLGVAASFYAQNHDFPRARELLHDAIAIDPKDQSSLSNLARLEMEAGDDSAARSALQALLAVDPASQTARLSLAQMDLRNQDTKSASEHLEAARSADDQAVEPRLLLAAQYLRERKTKEADAVLRELAALAEKNPAIAVVVGRLYTQAGRYDEALSQFRAAVRREPRNPSWLLEVARVQVARGDASGARDSLQKALEIEPLAVPANGLMISLELKEGHKEQALARALRVRAAHPEDASAAMLEGDVRLATRDAASASKAFADAYRLAPSSAAAIRTYQSRLAAHLTASTALLTDWLQRQPQDLNARTIYAQALLGQGENAAAIAQYEKIVAGGKPGAMALNNLAWLYQQGRDPRAEATAKRAYEQAPEVPAIADTYGWILVEAGQASVALPILERAAKATGATPGVRYHHAVALAKSGQTDEARGSLRVLVAGPAFPEAGEARALLKQLGEGS